ncbi:MAG: hypothetical protein HKN42_12990 [Granulosicoccus sp.]|nr:hypothetical protein [Granulosicoccus sp.]
MPSTSNLSTGDLDSVFTPPSHEQWLEAALAGLSADDSLEAMQHRTLDDLVIQALYDDCPAVTGESVMPADRPDTGSGTTSPACPWDNRLCIEDTTDEAVANACLHRALLGGNTSVELHLDETADIGRLLTGFRFDLAPVSFRASADYPGVTRNFLRYVNDESIDINELRCSFNADPIGQWLRTGVEPESSQAALQALASFSVETRRQLPEAVTALVDTTIHHNAGASATQELQAAVATGTLYLTHLMDAGMTLPEASQCIDFQVACDADLLMGVVKLRSLRILWQHVLHLHLSAPTGVTDPATTPGGMRIVVESSRRYLSQLDPWNNHLRNIIACSAAAMGSADAIIMHPHDRIGRWQATDDPDIGVRMARNLPIILERESGLTLVDDPFSGSYALETLTAELTRRVWSELSAMGELNDWLDTIASGRWQSAVADTHARRLALVNDEQQVIVGVNRYQNTAAGTARHPAQPAPVVTTSSPWIVDPNSKAVLQPVRDSESFEQRSSATQGATP